MTSSLPVELIAVLKEYAEFEFNQGEFDNTPPVATTLDEQGLHVYGSQEAVMEFLLILGYAARTADFNGERIDELINLSDGAKLARVDNGDVEVQLPKFLVGEPHWAPQESTVAPQ